MKAKPEKRRKRPQYPTRSEAAEDPTLREDLLSDVESRLGDYESHLGTPFSSVFVVPLTPSSVSGPPAQVAPIFQHGEGRGSAGCVVATPPVFLSEEEALQVISEILAEHGLTASDSPPAIEGFVFDDKASGARTPLVPDFFDPAKNVAVEFVSEDDYVGLCHGEFHSSVGSYDILDLAHTMSMAVREFSSGLYFAALYDPMVSYNLWDRKDHEDANARWERTKEQSRQLLREQVKDFVDWLKGQGVI